MYPELIDILDPRCLPKLAIPCCNIIKRKEETLESYFKVKSNKKKKKVENTIMTTNDKWLSSRDLLRYLVLEE